MRMANMGRLRLSLPPAGKSGGHGEEFFPSGTKSRWHFRQAVRLEFGASKAARACSNAWGWLLLLCLLPAISFSASAAEARVWPAPPDEPRIAFVRNLTGPADFGVKRSRAGKVMDWLTGAHADGQWFVKPFGLALDEQGGFCLTDTGANVVCYYDPARKAWHRWEKAGAVRFASPVAVAKQGRRFYVADSVLACVVVFDDSGRLLFQISSGLQRPAGVAICKDKLFVVDAQAQAVRVFDLQGQPLGQFGRRGNGAGEFNFPSHISADSAGELLVTDSMNSRIEVFDCEGHFLRQLGSRGDGPGYFNRPKGAAVDSFGHLYVLDALFDNFQIFDARGRLLMALGQTGQEPGEFWLPNAIAISRDNEIYIADSYNHRVQVFRFIGQP